MRQRYAGVDCRTGTTSAGNCRGEETCNTEACSGSKEFLGEIQCPGYNLYTTCLCVVDGVDKNNNRLQKYLVFCNRLLFLSTPTATHKHAEKTLSGL